MGKNNVEVNSSKKVVCQSILLLTWPAVIEYALQIMVTYVDYIMVGRLGVRASATVGLNTEVNFLVKGVNIAIGIGILVYISGHIGAGDVKTLMYVNLFINIIHIIINFLLIYYL